MGGRGGEYIKYTERLHEQQLEPHAGELEQLGGGHGEQHAALLVAAFERFDADGGRAAASPAAAAGRGGRS